jgi:acyl carrier protein
VTRADATAVRERIAGFFRAKLNLDIPSAEVDLFETGALDSLAFVELLLLLEQAFGVRVSIDELEIEKFRSIERIAEFVMTRNGAGDGSGDREEDPGDVPKRDGRAVEARRLSGS